MSRDWYINGETLARVRFGDHIAWGTSGGGGIVQSGSASNVCELGLSEGPVVISPIFRHRDVIVDDFGPHVPAEVLTQLAELRIRMPLIHFDEDVLEQCLDEALGGFARGDVHKQGTLAGAGIPLGAGLPLYASGNHYISVTLTSEQAAVPWRFKACYLANDPLVLPLGTKRSVAETTWRVIPYVPFAIAGVVQELKSYGAVLWDHTEDLP